MGESPVMDLGELEQLLRAADPAAFLVPSRLLRRAIRYDCGQGGLGLQVPHRKSLVIGREELLCAADPGELGLPPTAELPPVLFLIARPEPSRLAALSREQILVKYWQALFHCRVHLAFARHFPRDGAGEHRIGRLIQELGQAEFEEARRVLCQEKYLSPLTDERGVFEEFAAVYLEHRFFAANLLPHLFPAIDDFDRIDALLAEAIDAKALFEQTRLRGAPDPVLSAVRGALQSAPEGEEPTAVAPAAPCSEPRARQLLARADKSRGRGNLVRSALRRKQAERVCLGGETGRTAADDLDELVGRLQPALELSPAEAEEWRKALPPLLERAARGLWPVEARLLYDLQKVCVDHERGIYAVHGLSWLLSLGRRPLKQPLPNQREVLLLKHLRKASRRAVRIHVHDLERQELTGLLQAAVHRREELLRERLRPVLNGVFAKVGLQPRYFPERVGLHKLVEELLDRIVERGLLNIGDLRDAVSRNNLKLADLSGPGELIRGDPLLRLDRELAAALDGVYRPGEVYMRGLQRFSSVFFGTRVGRFLTRYLALPFGGAFVALKGLEEIIHVSHQFLTGEKAHHIHIANLLSVGLLGLFLLCLLYVAPFRQALVTGLTWLGRGLRALFLDLPAWLINLPLVQAGLRSPPVVFFARRLLPPLLFTGLIAPIFLLSECGWPATLGGCGAILAGTMVLFNSRLGRDLEEALADGALRLWYRLHADLIPGLVRLVLDFFRKVLEVIERLLYSVDEWLRFKTGESRLSLAAKAALGPVWFGLTYIIRIYVNLLIEPTVNPIKHFPVVTVSHKIMAPLIPTVFHILMTPLHPLGAWLAIPIASMTIFFLPGIFGFLVWEFKENWKLYRSNRSPVLRPVVIGHHGETMIRLMRPGIHSGTLPKLFARLRRAERRAHKSHLWKTAHHQLERLHHVEESVRHFVGRELVYLLRQSKGWDLDLHLGEVALGSNRIRVELAGPGATRDNLWLAFEEHWGWLMAGVARPGWLGLLTPQQTRVLATALAGLYKLAGVHLVREQVAACFGPQVPPYRLEKDCLVLRPEDAPVLYPLDEGEVLRPRTPNGEPAADFPVLSASQLLYSHLPLTWRSWVAAWEQDQAGESGEVPGMEEVPLLPAGQAVFTSV